MSFFKKAALYLGTFGLIFSSCENEPFEKANKPEGELILSQEMTQYSSGQKWY